MNNKEILNKRWNKIDKELSKFSSKFKYDIKERIQMIINTFKITNDNLYIYLTNNDLKLFRSELNDVLDDVDDTLKYKVKKMLQRTKIKYNEALQLLIEIAYFKVMNKSKKFEDELFTATATITSEIVQKESYDVRKPLLRKYHLIPLPNYLLPHIMSTPLYLGYNWLEYKQNMIDYNANKTYRKIAIDIQNKTLDLTRYEKSFNIERKRYITALDNETASISSEVALWGMNKQGIKKVRYVAVMDERTTNICKSMNGQIFSLEKKNVYYRYAQNNDDTMTRYETVGIKIGENQPALHYNCRSVLIPYK